MKRPWETLGKTHSYVYLHGGNKHKDTLGCPLVAYQRIDADTVYQTAEKELFDTVAPYIRKGKIVKFIAHNQPQS